MKIDQVINTARDSLTVKRVYADPIEKDGLTIIPAAKVQGGAGGGSGHDPKGQEGEGGGFGMIGRPAGVYVIKNGDISWRPAVDPNCLAAVLGWVIIVFVFCRYRLLRAQAMRSPD